MRLKSIKFVSVFFLLSIIVLSLPSFASPSIDLRSQLELVKLDNGMTFLLLKRQGAPVFSAQIRVRVGSIEEEQGFSGLAHFFEHMAFKGTDVIGSKDFSKEKPILDKILEIGTQISKMKKAGKPKSDYADLEAKRRELQKQQSQFIENNEFTRIYQQNGGKGLNATTSSDFTTYYVSLPSSKLELWAFLESHRLKHSVLREFYKERDVVAEERRMRYENDPNGRLFEALVTAGFYKSPYKTMAIGTAQDIQTYTPEAATNFYKKYYIPSRMVVSLVGNFDIDQAKQIIQKYFGDLPKKQDPQESFPSEDFSDNKFPRKVVLTGPESSRFFLGYHRPANPHPDDEVLDVIQNILCEGRVSRLYKKLILEERRVAQVGCYSAIPGARLDSLFAFYALPLKGYSNEKIEKMIQDEIEKLSQEGPTQKELDVVKNNIDADLIYSLQSNEGLASKLAYYQSLTGDWQYIYKLQDRIHAVTVEDVKRVLKKYFVPQRQVSAYFEQKVEKDILD